LVEFLEEIGEDGGEPQDLADPDAKDPEDTQGERDMEIENAQKEHHDA
jgi:hypothetical protein